MFDRLIALGPEVPRTITMPYSIGAFRSTTSGHPQEEALEAAGRNERIVLVGDFAKYGETAAVLIDEVTRQFPSANFAAILHWTQAVDDVNWLRELVGTLYVAVDSQISLSVADTIRINAPAWVIVPRPHMKWTDWIPSVLLRRANGDVLIWAPHENLPDGPFSSTDEIRIRLHELNNEHPLIHAHPAPGEWYGDQEWDDADMEKPEAGTHVVELRRRLDFEDAPDRVWRVRPAANLLYRLTLDPSVHAEYFTSLQSMNWFRAAAKTAARSRFGRILLAPLVFVLNVVETEKPWAYLRGFYDDARWEARRLAKWRAELEKSVLKLTREIHGR